MVERVRDDLLVAVRERAAAKGVTTESDLSHYPVGPVCEDAVPFSGSVLAGHRVARREVVDRVFKRQK